MPQTDPEALIAPVVSRSPLIAVVTLHDAALGPPLARALTAGGVAAVEITLRTPQGLEAVRRAVAEVPGATIGAGTCLTTADLEAARDAGAAFAVSPGLQPELLDRAVALSLPYLPGVATASEVMTALAHGYRTLKFFPAIPAGGASYLRALAGPFPQVRFCPTGGVNLERAAELIREPNVVCVGGSWFVPASLTRDQDWLEIEGQARRDLDRVSTG